MRRIAAPRMSGMKPKNSQKLPHPEAAEAVTQQSAGCTTTRRDGDGRKKTQKAQNDSVFVLFVPFRGPVFGVLTCGLIDKFPARKVARARWAAVLTRPASWASPNHQIESEKGNEL